MAAASGSLLLVPGLEKTKPSFRRAVWELGQGLGVDADHLVTVMSFETAHTFDPAIKNPFSGATGLIQFMASTAKALGTTLEDLAAMSAEDQLVYVEKYFSPYKGRLQTLDDVYMTVFYPAAVGKPPDHVVFSSPSKGYTQNAGFDKDHDGNITVREISASVHAVADAAGGKRITVGDPDLEVPPPEPSTTGPKWFLFSLASIAGFSLARWLKKVRRR